MIRVRHIHGRFNILADHLLRLDRPQNRMGLGSIGSEFHFPYAQLSHCEFVCDAIQSQTPIDVSPVQDRRIVNELEMHTHFHQQF